MLVKFKNMNQLKNFLTIDHKIHVIKALENGVLNDTILDVVSVTDNTVHAALPNNEVISIPFVKAKQAKFDQTGLIEYKGDKGQTKLMFEIIA